MEARLAEDAPPLQLACSLASGIIAQSVIMPIDTARSYLMAQPEGGTSAIRSGLAQDGALSFFYRGFRPACLRQGPVMLVQMPIVEQLRKVFGLEAF